MGNLPKDGRSQEIGRLAARALASKLPKAWIETPMAGDTDFGIDYSIQLKSTENYVNYSFYLQLKGTTVPKYNVDRSLISYDFDVSALNYYSQQEPLVMVAVVDLKEKEDDLSNCSIYYFWLEEDWFEKNKDKLESQKTISVQIPTDNLLDSSLDIYQFYKKRITEKNRFFSLKRSITERQKPIDEVLENLTTIISEKPVFLKTIELKNEAPWIDNPKGEIPTDLKICSDYLSSNRIQAAEEILNKLETIKDKFNDHELAEFYYQKGNLLSYQGFFDEAETQFKFAQEKNMKIRYRLAYLESKFKLDSMPSQDELEELANTLGNDSFTECALKAKTLAMLKRPIEGLELLKQYYPTEIMIQMVVCTIGYLSVELDQIIEENIENDFDDDRKHYIFNALAARRYFHKSSNDVGICGEILPIEGRPDYDLEGMKKAFSFLQKAWIAAQKLGYPADITILIDISPLIYGYFNKLEELTCYFDEILSERTAHSEIIRIYVLILFNCGQYQKVIDLLERLESLDAVECGMHILSYNHLKKSRQCLSLIEKYESILLNSSRENIPAIFCIGAEIADAMFNKDLATRYEEIVKSFPDGEAFIAIQDFVKKSNEDRSRHKEFTQDLYQKYINLGKPLVIAEQLIRYLDPQESMAANQLIELAEIVLERREFSEERYVDLAQAFITTERWADAERLAIKNIDKGLAVSKWRLVQAAALQNQGKIGVAYKTFEEVIKSENIGKQEKDFFINLSLSLGLIDNVVELLEDNLINSTNVLDKIFIIRRLIAIYMNRAEYEQKLKAAVLKYGEFIDHNNCDQEGDYLQLCTLLCPFENDEQVSDYTERRDKYLEKFPDSTVFKMGNINIDEGAEGLLESLRNMLGITPEQIELWESNKQKLRSGELPIPFFMRGQYLQDTRDIFTTWFLSKSVTDQELEFKIIHSPQLHQNEFYELIDSSDILLIEETSLLILNDLELLESFLQSLPKFSILESVLQKLNLTTHSPLSPYRQIAGEILRAIQNNLTKLDLIRLNEDSFLQYDQPLKDKKGVLITDDLYLRNLICMENNVIRTGNIFNILEFLSEKNIFAEDVLQEKLIHVSKSGIVNLNMRLDFLGKSLNYFLSGSEVLDYKDTDFQYLFDKIMFIHSDFKDKYKLFLDIFLYVDIQKISANTLLTLIYKLLEDENTYKPESVISTWFIYCGIGKKSERDLVTKISKEHLILWDKYLSVMKILNPNNFSTEYLLKAVLVVISSLNPDIKGIAFNNLKSVFAFDSVEFSVLSQLDNYLCDK